MTHDEAARLSWDELEALGLCDCGQPLAGHPPLKRPPPPGRVIPESSKPTISRKPRSP